VSISLAVMKDLSEIMLQINLIRWLRNALFISL